MRKSRRFIGGLSAGLLVLLVACSSWAKSPINTNRLGLAIKGYDVVAYFTMGKPTKGESAYSYKWKGAKWLFANVQNLGAFKADPKKYAPQYGGY